MDVNKLGSIASIIGFGLTVYQLCYKPETSWISLGILLLFSILFVVVLYQRNSSKHYLVAFKRIQEIHYDIIKSQEKYKHYNLEKSILELSDVFNQISAMFSEVRRAEASVCLKYTNQRDGIYYVKTLCRDSKSHNNRKHIDAEGMLDDISSNTDFRSIFEKIAEGKDWKDVYYNANYLPQKHQYNNTHLDSSELPDGMLSFWGRDRKWPLPYKSTIVAPILSDDSKDIYGYLCVDSAVNKGFNYSYDIKIVQDIALFLSPVVRTICESHLINNENDKT